MAEVGDGLLPHVGVQPLDGAAVQAQLDDGGGHGAVTREVAGESGPEARAR